MHGETTRLYLIRKSGSSPLLMDSEFRSRVATKIGRMSENSKNITVSVVMPVRDAERYIAEAIESLLAQTLSSWELLVIDDGCEDKTIDITNSFNDERIRVLELDGPHGIAVALNLGLQEAEGRYVARLDADDIAHPSRLQKQVEYMDANPKVGLLGSWFETIGASSQAFRHNPSSAEVLFTMILGNPICHSSAMLRMSVIREHFFQYRQDLVPSEDYDLWQRVATVADVEIFPDVLVQYRIHEAQSSQFLDPQRLKHDEVVKNNHRTALGLLFPRPGKTFGSVLWLSFNYLFWNPGPRESHQALRRLFPVKTFGLMRDGLKRIAPLVILARFFRKFRKKGRL